MAISFFLFQSIPQLSYSQIGDLEKAATHKKQAINLYNQGRYLEAVPIAKEALSINEKVLGPKHLNVAENLNLLALLYLSLKEIGMAKPLFQRSLAIYERWLGPKDPMVATNLDYLAQIYYYYHDYAKAESLYKRSLSIREKAFGPEDLYVAT